MCTEYILLLCSHSRRYLRCACLTGACTRSVVVHLYCSSRKFVHVTPEMLFASTPPHTRSPAQCSAPRARRNSSRATSPYISGRRSLGNSKPEMAEHLCAGSVKLSPRRHSGRPYAVYNIHTMYTQHAVFRIFAPPRPYTIHATPNVNIAYNYFMPGQWTLEFLDASWSFPLLLNFFF